MSIGWAFDMTVGVQVFGAYGSPHVPRFQDSTFDFAVPCSVSIQFIPTPYFHILISEIPPTDLCQRKSLDDSEYDTFR